MIENLIVALIVVLAALYVAAKYLPAGWRQRLVYLLTRRGAGHSKLARWLHTESSCGSGCDSCKSCADPVAPEPGAQRVIKLHRK